jgi:predicted DNA repair protein MutK
MLSLFSTLGGLLISGLPKLLDFFQNKADQRHELALARVQVELQLQMMAQGFAAQERMEEIRTDQIAMETDAQMTVAAYDHDKKIMEEASRWVVNFVGTVRPMVTYIFVLELCAINAWIAYYVYSRPGLVVSMDDLIRVSDIIFSTDEMAMLGGIIGFWFGSRSWSKK